MKSRFDIGDLLSRLYHSLRVDRRRYVIRFLQEADGNSLTTRELARQTASVELGVPEQQATGEPYRNAYNALTQTHLPTLSDAGIIIYDSNRQTATIGENFELAVLLWETDMIIVGHLSSQGNGSGSTGSRDRNE